MKIKSVLLIFLLVISTFTYAQKFYVTFVNDTNYNIDIRTAHRNVGWEDARDYYKEFTLTPGARSGLWEAKDINTFGSMHVLFTKITNYHRSIELVLQNPSHGFFGGKSYIAQAYSDMPNRLKTVNLGGKSSYNTYTPKVNQNGNGSREIFDSNIIINILQNRNGEFNLFHNGSPLPELQLE